MDFELNFSKKLGTYLEELGRVVYQKMDSFRISIKKTVGPIFANNC